MAVEDRENFGVRDTRKRPIGKHRADGFAIRASAAFERVDDGERRLALAQIGGNGLAQHILKRGQVEHVVDDLEGEAEVATILAERLLSLVRRCGDHGAELHRHLEQARRLAEDQVEVLFLVDQVAELFHLQQLAFDHLLCERDEQVKNAEVAFFQRRLEGLHVQPVAGENAFCIAPGGVRGRAAATCAGFVDDVVVDQRCGVQHLDDGAEPDARVRLAVQRLRGKQQQQRTNALAAAGDQVAGNVGDDFNIRGGLPCELPLDGGEIVADKVEDLCGSRDGEGTHAGLSVTGSFRRW